MTGEEAEKRNPEQSRYNFGSGIEIFLQIGQSGQRLNNAEAD